MRTIDPQLPMFIIGREGLALGRATAIVLVTALMDELFYVVAVPVVFLFVGMDNLFPAQLNNAFWGLPVRTIFWIGYGFIVLFFSFYITYLFIYRRIICLPSSKFGIIAEVYEEGFSEVHEGGKIKYDLTKH